MTVPDLSICIVNHGTPALLRECLQSIAATTQDMRTETWVVNNTPDGDGTIKTLIQQFPDVVWMQNETPLGFSANQNKMLQKAKGRYLMPLNADTVVKPGALRELVTFMDEQPGAGIAGPRLVYVDGRLQPTCHQFPNLITQFLEVSGAWKLFQGNPTIGKWFYLAGPHEKTAQVDWLMGACLIVRATAAHEVGYFNAQLFPVAYSEDIEWCWRMRQAGWLIMFDPHAVVVHLESQSPLENRNIQTWQGVYRFCARYYSRQQQYGIHVATWLASFLRQLLARDPHKRAIFRQLMALRMPAYPEQTCQANHLDKEQP